MIEAAMYFALGALAAGLLGLLLVPIVVRRAARLTQRRIEGSIPLSLDEIRAEKDQLRAEFALSTRRLELSVEELKKRAADQLFEIGKKRETIQMLGAERDDKIAAIVDLENREGDLRRTILQKEEEIAQVSRNLREVQRTLDMRSEDLKRVEERYAETRSDFDGQKVELVARSTQMDALRDEVATLRMERTADRARLVAAEARAEERAGEIAEAKARIAELDAAAEQRRADVAARDAEVEKKKGDLAALQAELSSGDGRAGDLEERLIAAETARLELEGEVASLRSRLEGERDAVERSGEVLKNRIGSLTAAKSLLEDKLATLVAENTGLKEEITRTNRSADRDWEAERSEHALLRERINDIAAEIGRMTAALEGEGSVINRILAESGKGKAASGNDADAGAMSLADRIRVLREVAAR